MNFQKLEIHGFKSFADKTSISFNEGITAIVGPNGCGKSNVADSIRWVLGEQRPTTLRGKSMADVIFNGTEARRSQSYAEVSLYFDNRTRTFPVEFDDIVLTRKIDRSGVGEYYINNGKCRLRDIVELLHKSNIGREGYSIVGQGRVDQIIMAKPEDRRSIFEEAAGIANFKTRRTDALRKLERADESLSRANDILHEIEARLGPLKRQAETARRYRELYDELKDQEINYYIYRYETNQSVIEQITDRLQAVILKAHETEQAYQANQDKYDKLLADIARIDEETAVANDELLRLRVDMEHIEGESRLYAERAMSAAGEVSRLEAEGNGQRRELDAKSAELVSRVNYKEQKATELELESQQLERLSAELEQLISKLSSDETDIEQSNRKLMLTMEEFADIKANLSKLLAEKDINEKRLASLLSVIGGKKEQLDKYYTAKAVLEAALENNKRERAAVAEQYNETVAERNDRREALRGFQEDKGKLASRISALEMRYNLMVSMKESYEGYQAAVRRLMQEIKVNSELARRVQGVVAELIKTPEGMEAAMETALGGALQNVVTADEDDAKYIIEYLKRKSFGRITFLPMTSIRGREPDQSMRQVLKEHGVVGFAAELVTYDKKYANIIRGILGTTVVVNNMDTAVRIAKAYRYSFKIVTLDGDLISTFGSMTGGSRKSDDSNILAKEREIEATKKNLEKARKDFEALKDMVVDAEQAIEEAENQIKRLESKLSELSVDNSVTLEKLSKNAEIFGDMEADVKATAHEIEEIKQSLRETDEKVALADSMESDIKNQRAKTDELVERSKTEVDQSKTRREDLTSKTMALRVKIAGIKGEIEKADSDIARLKSECSVISENISDLDARLMTARAGLQHIEAQSTRRVVSPEDRVKIDELVAKLESMRKFKQSAQEELSVLDAARVSLNDELKVLLEKRYKEQNSLEQTDSEIKYLHEHIWEEYELTYENAKEFRRDDYSSDGAQQSISKLKRQIAQLGEINPLAIQEYDDVIGRHGTLLQQRDDIEKGKAELIEIIDEITTEMTQKFDEAFNQINENYKVIFTELFGGGSGRLELVNRSPEEPLAAGIQIYAQPPGKRLQYIDLLSGGEKTLTAIAILFAIIKLRPMPFCVLDEIDTALDDANTSLLAQYLKRFSENTQFIVITHHKPTMEIADSLYGVTMEEKGVSKLVSVKLSEAIAHASEN